MMADAKRHSVSHLPFERQPNHLTLLLVCALG